MRPLSIVTTLVQQQQQHFSRLGFSESGIQSLGLGVSESYIKMQFPLTRLTWGLSGKEDLLVQTDTAS